jgi:hypothetical protein
MKDAVLRELAQRWEEDAKEPGVQDGSPEGAIRNAELQGDRRAKRECAETLRMVIAICGDRT